MPDPGEPEDKRPPHEIDDLRERLQRAERERNRLQRETERLRRENERLKQQLDAARRAGFRQAAPFSKGLPSPTPHPSGRHPGRRYGRPARRRVPRQIDETVDVPLPACCPRCGGQVRETRVATQYQEELPVARVHVRAFRVHVGRCDDCLRRVQGRHPLQTSDALGAAAAQLGPHAVAFAAILNKQLGLSFGKITTLFQQRYGLTVSRGGLVHAVHRAARRAHPTYVALGQAIRASPIVAPDETGWKVAGTLQWLWAVATPRTTLFAILPGRGVPDAARLLGADFAGTIVRDGWAPYRRFTAARHQSCLAHLLHRCRQLAADHPRVAFLSAVRALLQQALDLRDRHAAGRVSSHGLAVATGHLVHRLDRLLDAPGAVPVVQRFAAHLSVEFPALFTFLTDAAIDATTWRAEQALRPAVVTRKVCGGNRSWRGAATQQILASVIRTATQRAVDPHALLVSLLQAPQPIVPRTFGPRALH